MRYLVTDEQKREELNKLEIEEGVFMEAEYVEGTGRQYNVCGTAAIDGEIYRDFVIEFETAEEPTELSAAGILRLDWDWYDYSFQSVNHEEE